MESKLNRRDLLRAGALLGVASVLPGSLVHAASAAAPALPLGRTRALRFAHLTDLHIQPEKSAGEGVTMCLKHIEAMKDKPQLILTGGDHVMDSFEQGHERTKVQWDLYTKTFKDNTGIPSEHCVGNHDCWGWNKKKSGTTGEEANWGKKYACDELGMPKQYYSFERGGWRFISLDSVTPNGDGYIGKLDEEQRAWLEGLLKADTKTPTVVLTHIPIVAVCTAIRSVKKDSKEWTASFASQHQDGAELHKLFTSAGNVKLCLSGHIHLNDRVELGWPGAAWNSPKVTYICDGAVCGAWWDGRKGNCDEGYGVVDLYDDGTFEHEYVVYGWKAKG